MKSFNEATHQVAGLMAAIGGNVDAYEEETTSSAPPVVATNSFEAAYASAQSHIQHNEPTGRTVPQDINEATYQATGKTNAELMRDMAQTSEEMGGLTVPAETDVNTVIQQMNERLDVVDDPFVPDEVIEEDIVPTPEEEEMLTRMRELIPDIDIDDKQEDGKFWSCMLNDVYIPSAPVPMESCYSLFGSVFKDGAGELEEIYNAFNDAVRTGEPQTVSLDSGNVEMELLGNDWRIFDAAKNRQYVQQTMHGAGGMDDHYDLIEEGDLFVWVIDSASDEDDLGYLHNKWVFLRESA
jgi:hypothetical protein